MGRYILRIDRDAKGQPKTIEFEGADPHEAFALLGRERGVSSASLWQDGACLGTLRRQGENFWELSGQEAPCTESIASRRAS